VKLRQTMPVKAMQSDHPLITILITTKDRPDDLRRTLHELRRQDYSSIEMIVIDDGSTHRLETIVREEWPTAVYVRESESRGCPQRRSEGFLIAKGDYIVEFDDDSAPVAPDALSLAVKFMEDNRSVGILGFHICNSFVLPEDYSRPDAKYASNFVGCGVLFRTAAVRQVGGYQAFFEGEWEESEYSLRILKAGWSVYFFPDVLIHHRVSPLQRRMARSWARAFRNKLWAMVLHYPVNRLIVEGTWTLGLAAFDAVRLFRVNYFVKGLGQFLAGLPRAVRMRRPMSFETLKLYDALRFKRILTEEQFRSSPSCSLADFCRHYRRNWLNRPRQRSFWDRRSGDVGSGDTVMFAHELIGGSHRSPRSDHAPDQVRNSRK
jgi:GT2 family glycosyltransferase